MKKILLELLHKLDVKHQQYIAAFFLSILIISIGWLVYTRITSHPVVSKVSKKEEKVIEEEPKKIELIAKKIGGIRCRKRKIKSKMK
jgi:hypothetical protein